MLLRLVVIALITLIASPSAADVKQCIDDHKSAQEDDRAGRLVAARDRFQRCANAACPQMIRDECKLLHTQTQQRIPTIRIRAQLEAGATAHVRIDGAAALPVTPTSIEIDPGKHTVVIQTSDGRSQSREVEVAAGTKNHDVVFVFEATRAPTPPGPDPAPNPNGTTSNVPTPTPMPPDGDGGPSYTGPLVMTIIGGGALVLFGLAAAAGFAKQNELDACKPSCEQADVDQMRTRYIIADTMLGVAGASLGAALIWYLVVSGDEPDRSAIRATPTGLVVSF